jgi:hypothetical protein
LLVSDTVNFLLISHYFPRGVNAFLKRLGKSYLRTLRITNFPRKVTNGTAISTAVATLCLHDTHTLALFAQINTAMTVEALNGTTESFHSFFSETRPHPGQVS